LDILRDAARGYFPSDWNSANILGHGRNHLVGTGPREGISSMYILSADAEIAVADGFSDMREVLRGVPNGHRLKGMPADRVYREVLKRIVRVREEHRERIEAIDAELFQSRPLLAVHYRAQTSPKSIEALEQAGVDDAEYAAHIDKFLDTYATGTIFLLSD